MKSPQSKIDLLTLLLAVVIIPTLGLTCVFVFHTPAKELGSQTAASFIAILISFVAVLLFLKLPGIKPDVPPHIISDIIKGVTSNMEKYFNDKESPSSAIIEFYETFRDIRWATYFETTTKQFDVVVNYWDSWAGNHHEQLRELFARGVVVNIFLPDPSNKALIQELGRLYPDHKAQNISIKILQTADFLNKARIESGVAEESLKIYFSQHFLNYAVQRMDLKTLVFSNFDMFRENRIGAPAYVLDLAKSKKAGEYWDSELEGLKKTCKQKTPAQIQRLLKRYENARN